MKLDCKPYEVKIFRNVPTSGLTLKKDVAAMIDKLERARSARNNFLHGKGNDVEIDSSNPSRRNNLCQQGKLFDGTIDNLAWEHIGRRGKDGWLELSFPKFVPTFKKIRLFGYNTDGVVVKIWKFGEWKTITEKPVKCGEYGLEWELAKAQRTVKIRFDFPGSVKKNKVEIYEVELVK